MSDEIIHNASSAEHLCPDPLHVLKGQMLNPDFTSTTGTRLVDIVLHFKPAASSLPMHSLSNARSRPSLQSPPDLSTADR